MPDEPVIAIRYWRNAEALEIETRSGKEAIRE
jgi:hypothetical protein